MAMSGVGGSSLSLDLRGRRTSSSPERQPFLVQRTVREIGNIVPNSHPHQLWQVSGVDEGKLRDCGAR